MEVCISFPGSEDGFAASDSSCLYKLFKNSGTVKTSALSAPIFYRHMHGQGFPFTSLNGMWPFAKTLKHSPNLCTVNFEHKALSGAPLGGRGSPSWAGRWLFSPRSCDSIEFATIQAGHLKGWPRHWRDCSEGVLLLPWVAAGWVKPLHLHRREAAESRSQMLVAFFASKHSLVSREILRWALAGPWKELHWILYQGEVTVCWAAVFKTPVEAWCSAAAGEAGAGTWFWASALTIAWNFCTWSVPCEFSIHCNVEGGGNV